MYRRLFIVSSAFAFASINAQTQIQFLTPKSFETQIRQNAEILSTTWYFILSNKKGEWRKIYASKVETEFLDVVKSESLIYPYVGKVMIRMEITDGRYHPTIEEAKADERDPKLIIDPMQTSSNIFDLQFVPEGSAWTFRSGQSKSSFSEMFLDYKEWHPINLNKNSAYKWVYKSIIKHLSMPEKS